MAVILAVNQVLIVRTSFLYRGLSDRSLRRGGPERQSGHYRSMGILPMSSRRVSPLGSEAIGVAASPRGQSAKLRIGGLAPRAAAKSGVPMDGKQPPLFGAGIVGNALPGSR
jgi:hypothetical protein